MIAVRWGRVITIVSDAARTGEKFVAVYAAAKAGAAALTRCVASENGQHGITANAISLGTMRTPATEPLWSVPDHPAAARILKRYAIRRPGTPEDIGAMAVFLAERSGLVDHRPDLRRQRWQRHQLTSCAAARRMPACVPPSQRMSTPVR